MTIQESIRRAIRAENAWRKWNDNDLARQIGMSQTAFSQRMNKRDFRLDEIEEISNRYGISLSELIRRAEENQEKEQQQKQQNEAKEKTSGNNS